LNQSKSKVKAKSMLSTRNARIARMEKIPAVKRWMAKSKQLYQGIQRLNVRYKSMDNVSGTALRMPAWPAGGNEVLKLQSIDPFPIPDACDSFTLTFVQPVHMANIYLEKEVDSGEKPKTVQKQAINNSNKLVISMEGLEQGTWILHYEDVKRNKVKLSMPLVIANQEQEALTVWGEKLQVAYPGEVAHRVFIKSPTGHVTEIRSTDPSARNNAEAAERNQEESESDSTVTNEPVPLYELGKHILFSETGKFIKPIIVNPPPYITDINSVEHVLFSNVLNGYRLKLSEGYGKKIRRVTLYGDRANYVYWDNVEYEEDTKAYLLDYNKAVVSCRKSGYKYNNDYKYQLQLKLSDLSENYILRRDIPV